MKNNKTPLVSIGMPVYNEGKFIAKTIESLLKQNYENIELIITDNNSQDDTQEICLTYAEKDHRICYYRNRANIGMLRNFNLAFDLSRGEYFLWALGHDLWKPSFINRCVAILNSDPDVVLCYTSGFLINSEDKIISPLRDEIDTRNLTLEERLRKIFEMKAGLAFCGLMRSYAVDRVMPFKHYEIAGNDWLFLFKLSTLGSFALIDEPLFYLRKTREEKSQEETVTRVLKMLNPHCEQYRFIFDTHMLSTYDLHLQVIDRLKIDREKRDFLLKDVINCLKKKYGDSSLRESEKLAADINKRFSGIKDLDFSSIRDAHIALKYVNIGLLFHPESSILQEAHHLLTKFNFSALLNEMKQNETSTLIPKADAKNNENKSPSIAPSHQERENLSFHVGEGEKFGHLPGDIKTKSGKNPSPLLGEGKGEGNFQIKNDKDEKSSPLVSVIIPTRNRPEFLSKALESILRQTYKNIEVIVVNDAGEDVSQVINAFRDRLTVKYLTHDINKDRSAARNTAIKHASGQYIAYLDDDDIFHPHHVETAVKVLTTTDYKVVYTDACRAYQIKSGDTYQTIKKDVPYSIDYVKGIFYKTNITPILCVVHDRMCFDEIGVFDESLPVLEDWDLWIRMSEKYDFYHVKKVTCEFSWRVDGTSTTSSKQAEFARIRELIYKRYSKNLQEVLKTQQSVTDLTHITPPQKLVSIVILTWNAQEYTQKCVNSIQNHTKYPHEIIFVDNASTDGTVEYLRNLVREHPNYKLIENQENKGFAAGNNQGVATANSEYVMLLNNDVLVSDGWLEGLVESLEKDEKIGMVGPITNSISGRQQVIAIPYADEKGFHEFAQGIRRTYKGRLTPRHRIAGFAVLMKKALYQEAGGMDESFGTGNYEDDDLCLKVQEKGYAIMVDEGVFIHHYKSQTFIDNKINYRNSLSVNGTKFKGKWPNVDYEQLLELHGSLVDANAALCAKGKQAQESGNINEAIEIYSKVLKTNPVDEAALCGLALVYQTDGKMDKTIDAYKKALQVNPSFFDAHYNLAIVYSTINQIDDAIAHLNKAINLNSGDASIHNNLGVLYFRKNMYNDAKNCFEKALLIDTHYKEAQQNIEKVSKVLKKA